MVMGFGDFSIDALTAWPGPVWRDFGLRTLTAGGVVSFARTDPILMVLAPVAQWTERLPSKQRVGGSSPSRRARPSGSGWPSSPPAKFGNPVNLERETALQYSCESLPKTHKSKLGTACALSSETAKCGSGRYSQIGRLFGMLKNAGPAVTLEEMERAIVEGACEE